MSTASPRSASRPLFAARGPTSITESPSRKERSLFLHGAGEPIAHSSPHSSPRSITSRLAALQHARTHSGEHHSMAASTNQAPFKLKDESADNEKSEDGRTVLLGEGKLEGSSKSLLITATEPGDAPPPDLTLVSKSRANSDAGSPMMRAMHRFHPGVDLSKQAGEDDLVGRKQQQPHPLSTTTTSIGAAASPPVVEPEKLAPPPKQLDAPLDTMRPEASASAAAAAAAPASGDSSLGSSSSGSNWAQPNAAPAPRADQTNLLDQWSTLKSQLAGKVPVVFLDYDGTLTPIVSEPSQAIIAEEQRTRLAKLASKCPVAIVTGRKVKTIEKFILGGGKAQLPGLEKVFFAGSHGFDIKCPATSGLSNKQVADDFLPQLRSFWSKCQEGCGHIPGALVEDNTYSISIHYRNVKTEAEVEKINEVVTAALKPFEAQGQLQRFQGKMVHEIRPNIDWHKGAAVHYLLDLMYPSLLRTEGDASKPLRLPDGRELLPVYVGDDTTDEDAFRLLAKFDRADQSHKSLSIFVRTDDKARPSAANFVLRNPQEVGQMLEKLTELC